MSLRTEALRYLGIKKDPDTLTAERVGEYLTWLGNISGATVTRELPCEVSGKTINFTGITVESVDLAAHIHGCKAVILFAATLGAAVTKRYRALSAVSVADALIFDACANAYIEQVCDKACFELSKGRNITERYSPGYGDFGLSFQPVMLELLNAQRRIGLTLSGGGMLIPEKSVTAVIGVL